MSVTYVPQLITDDKAHLIVMLDKSFYTVEEAAELYKKLDKSVIYNENSVVKIYGKNIPIPRKQVAYGDPGTSYTFSNTKVDAKPWIEILLKIKADIEYMTDLKFNFCLVNKYDNGNNYIGYHSDDEKDLGPNPSIASVSFGQERKFYFKSKETDKVTQLKLNSGCLCMMYNPTNTYYKHSVPKETKVTGTRINLTFRSINI
jgi:alpha-ketoglutarate-dependent dioxygenase alkB family protein 2